jgi:hypothetical protein
MADGPTHINGNKLDCILSSHINVITNLSCTPPDGVFPTDHYLIDFEIRLIFQRLSQSNALFMIIKTLILMIFVLILGEFSLAWQYQRRQISTTVGKFGEICLT